MKLTKSVRKKIGWLVVLGAVVAMVLGNLSVSTPLESVLSDIAAMLALGVGMALIVA